MNSTRMAELARKSLEKKASLGRLGRKGVQMAGRMAKSDMAGVAGYIAEGQPLLTNVAGGASLGIAGGVIGEIIAKLRGDEGAGVSRLFSETIPRSAGVGATLGLARYGAGRSIAKGQKGLKSLAPKVRNPGGVKGMPLSGVGEARRAEGLKQMSRGAYAGRAAEAGSVGAGAAIGASKSKPKKQETDKKDKDTEKKSSARKDALIGALGGIVGAGVGGAVFVGANRSKPKKQETDKKDKDTEKKSSNALVKHVANPLLAGAKSTPILERLIQGFKNTGAVGRGAMLAGGAQAGSEAGKYLAGDKDQTAYTALRNTALMSGFGAGAGGLLRSGARGMQADVAKGVTHADALAPLNMIAGLSRSPAVLAYLTAASGASGLIEGARNRE